MKGNGENADIFYLKLLRLVEEQQQQQQAGCNTSTVAPLHQHRGNRDRRSLSLPAGQSSQSVRDPISEDRVQ